MSEAITVLSDIRKNEHEKSMKELSDRDLCEMMRAHFESHPCLPGEKTVKNKVNQLLALFENDQHTAADNAFNNSEWVPAANTPFDSGFKLDPADRKDLMSSYINTRIRQTPLKEGNYYLDFRKFGADDLKNKSINLPEYCHPQLGTKVPIIVVNVELQKNDAGEVYVMAETKDDGLRMIGHLPDNFLKNNPMKVDSCEGELQIADFSNGKLKNISARVVVDSDLMSGDVVDLDDDLLNGLDQSDSMEQ